MCDTGRSGDMQRERDFVRVRDDRRQHLRDRPVRADDLEVVIQDGTTPLELEDVDVAPADVDVRDRLVFAVGGPAPSDGPDVIAFRGERYDLRVAEVRDQDPAAAVHSDLGEGGDDVEAGLLPAADGGDGVQGDHAVGAGHLAGDGGGGLGAEGGWLRGGEGRSEGGQGRDDGFGESGAKACQSSGESMNNSGRVPLGHTRIVFAQPRHSCLAFQCAARQSPVADHAPRRPRCGPLGRSSAGVPGRVLGLGVGRQQIGVGRRHVYSRQWLMNSVHPPRF